MSPTPNQPAAFHVMTKPIGPICNLDCRYCFYLEKEGLYAGNRHWRMADETLERYVREYIEGQDAPNITFAWQGGEPTLLGAGFFRRVVELQARYANGKRIENALQTNGTLLDDDWGEFLSEHRFLVGLSIDGPAHLHDLYRVGKSGDPTHELVMRGLDVLQRHKVEFNTLTVVNRRNSQEPLEVYRFLQGIGSRYLQFIPLVERCDTAPDQGPSHGLSGPPAIASQQARVTDWSVRPNDYGKFLCAIFDDWVRKDVGQTYVQMFDVALGMWTGAGETLCVFAETCGRGLALEHNGDLYSCDHFVYPEYRLGKVGETSLGDMVTSPRQVAFGEAKRDALPRACRECRWRFACNGECPKHRFNYTTDGEPGLNYLCQAYKRFFAHVDEPMRTMAELLRRRRAPAEIMGILGADGKPRAQQAPGRNSPCPCGSGRKFKHCCLRG